MDKTDVRGPPQRKGVAFQSSHNRACRGGWPALPAPPTPGVSLCLPGQCHPGRWPEPRRAGGRGRDHGAPTELPLCTEGTGALKTHSPKGSLFQPPSELLFSVEELH